MSTTPTQNAQTIQTVPKSATETAPLTFDPFNTNPTPQMFADKWRAVDR